MGDLWLPDAGGFLVASGSPEELARRPESHTGRFLRQILPQ
jgi:excinuclease ABC subunit A